MTTSKRIASFTLDSRTNEAQARLAPAGRVILFAKDDTHNDLVDVWVEAMREDMAAAATTLVETPRKFVVVHGLSDVPDGYIYTASTLSATGDSYHLYELEPSNERVKPEAKVETTEHDAPYFYFYLTTKEERPVRLIQGKTLLPGLLSLLGTYTECGSLAAGHFITKLQKEGYAQVVGGTQHALYVFTAVVDKDAERPLVI